jgi:raffinose/stachyose/melibiose transport system permease protein
VGEKRRKWNVLLMKTVSSVLVLTWTVVAFMPFIFMLMSTFKEKTEFFKRGVWALPRSFSLDNYVKVLESDFFVYLRNSILVVAFSLILLLFSASLASYVFARIPLKMNAVLFGAVVACMSIPVHVSFIPVFLLTQSLGIYDTLWALIGPYITFNIPVSVFILTGFMRCIPREIDESARMDGCGLIQTFSHIALPLSLAGVATLAIYNGINMWNEFSFALILTQSVGNRTLPLATWQYRGEYASNLPMIMTVLTLATLPMVLTFLTGQERLVEGMMAGAVKG